MVLANRYDLVAILQNLIDNARKYAPGSPILITCEPAGPYLKLAIQDEGPGIGAEGAEDLFLPGARRGPTPRGMGWASPFRVAWPSAWAGPCGTSLAPAGALVSFSSCPAPAVCPVAAEEAP